jgi:ADP-dependent NAD(P)H-hydrate dehydratase / NAD(P)H-hydrate epimerase
MKIFDSKNIHVLDKLTIERQEISSLELMERAALKVFLWLVGHFHDKKQVYHIFCGVGNNGGDGLVLARLLKQNYFTVYVYVIPFSDVYSADFKANLERLREYSITPVFLTEDSAFPTVNEHDCIVDAIFGIGLTRDLDEWIQKIIQKINYHHSFTVSVDVPSGMYLNKKTKIAIQSDVVLTFQFPKFAFFMPENETFVSEIVILDIELDQAAIEESVTHQFYLDLKEIKKRYQPMGKFSHKGTQGHALLIGGCFGKIGSMVLASRAALRSGCGLATVLVPKCGYEILQTASPEAMVITDVNYHKITHIDLDFGPKAIGIGMGLGLDEETMEAFHLFLVENTLPLVIDADGLNILAAHPEWLSLLVRNSILTPHPKELERLIGVWEDDFDKINKTQLFAQKYEVVILIKGAYTLIIDEKNSYVNPTGNQALATGGSGDVLAGMITSFRAQGYSALDSALLGVYLHGKTANIAVEEMGYESFIASDIINYLGKAFLELKD